MAKNIKIIIVSGLIVIGLIIGHYVIDNRSTNNLLGGRSGDSNTITEYKRVSTGAQQVIFTGPFRLERLIIGKDVSTSGISLSDTTTTTNYSPFVTFSGDTLHGVYEFGLNFVNGLVVTVTNSTENLFIISHN